MVDKRYYEKFVMEDYNMTYQKNLYVNKDIGKLLIMQ